MCRSRRIPALVSDINELCKYEGYWLICIPGCQAGPAIISKNGKLIDEPTGEEFTEQEIAQISCFDEENGTTYKRL